MIGDKEEKGERDGWREGGRQKDKEKEMKMYIGMDGFRGILFSNNSWFLWGHLGGVTAPAMKFLLTRTRETLLEFSDCTIMTTSRFGNISL